MSEGQINPATMWWWAFLIALGRAPSMEYEMNQKIKLMVLLSIFANGAIEAIDQEKRARALGDEAQARYHRARHDNYTVWVNATGQMLDGLLARGRK